LWPADRRTTVLNEVSKVALVPANLRGSISRQFVALLAECGSPPTGAIGYTGAWSQTEREWFSSSPESTTRLQVFILMIGRNAAPAPAPHKTFEVGGVMLHLSTPDTTDQSWIGQDAVLRQLLACWLVVDQRDLPLAPRLTGAPGIGKTTLAMAAARLRNQPLFINQCTADTRPEDLIVTPVLAESGKIAYHASPLVSAMLAGGVCVLDEGNRMNEKSWASLAPLLDHRRYVESIVAGITIAAHADFRVCVTMNEDESTYEVPDYILSRLQPTLLLGFPSRDDEMAILKYHLPFAEDSLLALTVEFLQQAHHLKLDFSPRDGINLLRFAIKRMAQDPAHPIGRDVAWREALYCVLGEEAADLENAARRKRRSLGGQHAPLGLGDLFFSPDDPLHPDAPDDSVNDDDDDD
jgi:MoxR-like ATPase